MNNISNPIISDFKINKDLIWQMSRAEKYTLIEILRSIKPQVSLEIGTYMGGSLQVLSRFSSSVYSIDISGEPEKFLKNTFKNVKFLKGKSKELINPTISKIIESNNKLEFILIDGDHSKKGVKNDLNEILKFKYKNPLTILLHDSFNPSCRRGIKSINYKNFPNIEYIDLDYVSGSFSPNDDYREMWGGFCIIKINPDSTKVAKINSSQSELYNSSYLFSIHLLKDIFFFLKPFKRLVYSLLGKRKKQDVYFNFNK